jgi:hypothetical protein
LILAPLGLLAYLAATRCCYGQSVNDLLGTFNLIEDGRVIEYIRLERRDHGFVLSRMHAGQWLAPIGVAPLSRQKLEAIIRQRVDVAFESLGDDRLAVLKVPKGWKIGSFVCSTGYLLATMLGPAELHKV